MNPRHIVMAIALAGALGVAIFGDRSPSAPTVSEATSASASKAQVAVSPKAAVALSTDVTASTLPGMQTVQPERAAVGHEHEKASTQMILPLRPRQALIARSDNGLRPNLFGIHSFTPAPPPPPTNVVQNSAPAVETPPELPFKFLGRQDTGTGWKVFLANDDATFIAGESDIVADTYKVVSISATAITFEYIPTHAQTTLQIE